MAQLEARLVSAARNVWTLITRWLILMLLWTALADVALSRDFYLAPTGDDQNIGSIDHPFATLERARDALRASRREGTSLGSGAVTIWLAGGIYQRAKTFDLSAEDSGSLASPIIYRALPGAAVRVMGGRVLDAWMPIDDPAILARFDPAARGHVRQVSLTALGIADPGAMVSRGFNRGDKKSGIELCYNLQPMTLARWPNHDWLTIAATPSAAAEINERGVTMGKLTGGFHYADDRPRRWAASDDLWVHGYWAYDWANSYERIAVLDQGNRLIKTQPPFGQYAYLTGQRFYFLNVLEELDEPGEYYVDRARGLIYFWSPGPLPLAEVTASLLADPLVRLRDVDHVTFRGIIFECTRASAVEITGGSNCLIVGCTIRNTGAGAITIEQGLNHGVRSCDIHHNGDGGVKIHGGDRRTLTPCNHFVENCHFHHQAQWSRCYYPAVHATGVGIRIAHNLIHDNPHCAILYVGTDITVEYNEIYRVCTETGDVGAIYTGRDWTARGNHVRYNFIHHIGGLGMGSMAVYLDDCVSGQAVTGNIFYKTQRAIFIGGGRDNHVQNNFFVDCQPAVMIDGRGLLPDLAWRDMVYGVLQQELVASNHHALPYATRFPELTQLDALYQSGQGIPPEGTQVINNLNVGGEWLVIYRGAEAKHVTQRGNLSTLDPGFTDPDYTHSLDFSLRDDAPILLEGMQRIPSEKIGLVIDADRHNRPRVLSRLALISRSTDSSQVQVRLTVRNTSESAWVGLVRVIAKPVESVSWTMRRSAGVESVGTLACRLRSGESATADFGVTVAVGATKFEVAADTPGLRPTWETLNRPLR